MRKLSAFNIASILPGVAFLYAPIAFLVVHSFNASGLVATWGGWSLRWYGELAGDGPLLEAAFVSLRLAFVVATAATILGALAAIALVRFGRFRGRLVFTTMIYSPLVMPEVIAGSPWCCCSWLSPSIAVFGRSPSRIPPWRCASLL
jgi:putrescine transport system permease protein